jgi:phage terminase large subunit-like protein
MPAGLSSIMSYTGTIEKGLVKLPPEATWPDGTIVRVEAIESPEPTTALHQQWVDEGLASGPAEPKSQADWNALKDRVFQGGRK